MEIGRSASVMLVVRQADTAVAVGSGDVPVLATPRVVALFEEATVAAVRDGLGSGETTVGTRVDVEHLRPTAVGATVEARATLTAAEGRRLTFVVSLLEGDVEAARGSVTRAVVDRDGFLSRL